MKWSLCGPVTASGMSSDQDSNDIWGTDGSLF